MQTKSNHHSTISEGHDWFMDAVVHVMVALAIGVACVGYWQFGWFFIPLAIMQVVVSIMLARTASRVIIAVKYREDVAASAIAITVLCFAIEFWGVHMGLARFNAMNMADAKIVLTETEMNFASAGLGLFNLFARRSYVTGLKDLVPWEIDRAEMREKIRAAKLLKRTQSHDDARQNESSADGFMKGLGNSEKREREYEFRAMEDQRERALKEA